MLPTKQLKQTTERRRPKAKKGNRRKEVKSGQRVRQRDKRRSRQRSRQRGRTKRIRLRSKRPKLRERGRQRDKTPRLKRQVKTTARKKTLIAVAVSRSSSRRNNFMVYQYKATWKYSQQYSTRKFSISSAQTRICATRWVAN